MPRYLVKKLGFIDGKLYDPTGKRRELITDTPLEPVPSWLQPVKEESSASRKKRTKKEADAAKKNADKALEDKQDVDHVTFATAPPKANVETL